VVVAGGAVAVALVAVLSGLARAWAAARAPGGLLGQARDAAPGRGSAVARALAGAGLPPSVLIGMRMALERGRGRGSVPVRATTVALAVAIAAVAAILSFRAGLDHLTGTPRLYGQTYDAWGATEPATERTLSRLTHDRTISAVSAVTLTNAVVAGRSATLMAIEPRKGAIPLAMAAGHAPETERETALGTRTLADAGVRIGDTVRIDAGLGPRRMRVVGRAVLPNTSGPAGAVRPAEGALVTVPGLRALGSHERSSRVLVRFARHVDPRAGLAHLGTEFAPPVTPVDIENFNRVEQAPLAMAVLFALASAAALTHALMLSGRRRRRDLALLKTLGLAPRQVAGAIAWQALTMVVVALAAGLPLGVAGGRLAWHLFADRAGFVAEAVTPWLGIMLLCPVALSFSLLVALIPAVSAARVWPAPALRTE
jgi:ABC-type lipoprotein release transport system permease subunit